MGWREGERKRESEKERERECVCERERGESSEIFSCASKRCADLRRLVLYLKSETWAYPTPRAPSNLPDTPDASRTIPRL
jgi:hypothetical protein